MSHVQDLIIDKAYIGGQWRDADRHFSVTNPATGETLAEVPDLNAEEVREAIGAADAAWADWKRKTAKERSALLRAWFNSIMDHQEALAELMTREQGKPLAESRGEVAYGAAFVEFYAEEAKRVAGETLPGHGPDKRILVFREPVGVVAAITPWNFPLAMITRKCAPAMAAGCTVVVKPAEATPLTALALAKLAEDVGIPAGVLNVVTSSSPREVGPVLTGDTRVRKVSFTGSTPVGKILLAQCADTVKKASMELGGNAPFIVFDDADLDAAVEGAIASKYRNSGQTCVCTNRFLVQDGVYDAFVEKLAKRVGELKVGNGLEDGVVQGPPDQRGSGGQGAVAYCRRPRQRCPPGRRRRGPGGHLLPAHGAGRRDHRHACGPGRDLRPAGPGVPLLQRRRSHRHGQRHRVRSGRLLLCHRLSPYLAHHGTTRVRHGRHQ